MISLKTNYLGLELQTPIVVASSGFTASVDDIVELEKNGAGAVVLKSLFEEEIVADMEKNMNKMFSENYLYPETMEFYENYDTEDTLTNYLQLIAECKKAVKIPIIASVNCVTPYNWPYFAKNLQDAGADALELNVFMLPTDVDQTSAEIEKIYFDIIEAVRKEVTIPIALKVSSYFTSLTQTMHQLSKSGVSGLVLFNRYFSPDIDIENFELESSHFLSSADDYLMTLRWISILSGKTACDLSASTGVHDGKTAIKMILAGAQTVQVASTIYKNGKEQIAKILFDMQTWMESKNFENIEQFRGKMNLANAQSPAGLLRVQFMRNFAQLKR